MDKVMGKHVRNQQANPSKSVTVHLLSAKSGIGATNPPSILPSHNRPLRPSRSMGRQSSQHKTKQRVLVEGKRKIWGTMKTTSTAAVSHTITTLTKTAGLLVKRKFKTSHGENSTRVSKWWFVVSGDEEVLKQLDKQWPSVSLQTKWSIEPIFCFNNEDVCPSADEPEVPEPAAGSSSLQLTTEISSPVQTSEPSSPVLTADSSSPLQDSSIPSTEYNPLATHQN